jgi:hypothetical protein
MYGIPAKRIRQDGIAKRLKRHRVDANRRQVMKKSGSRGIVSQRFETKFARKDLIGNPG